MGSHKRIVVGIRLWLLFLVGCGHESSGEGGDPPRDGSVDGSSVSSECAGLTSPFLEADCLAALRDRCRSRANDADCTMGGPLIFGGGAYKIFCTWSKVVRFSDLTTCAVETVFHRCEGTIKQDLVVCRDPCTATPDIFSRWTAIPSEQELVRVECGGPIGPWSAVGSTPGSYTGACLGNIMPPAPDLCRCESTACAASNVGGTLE